jgi:hypothetical protein
VTRSQIIFAIARFRTSRFLALSGIGGHAAVDTDVCQDAPKNEE